MARHESADPHGPDRFGSRAGRWERIYHETSLEGVIHQERQALALRWIDDLGLAPCTPVLDVGCGAGQTAVALGRRGFRVTAIDSSPGMIQAAVSQTAAAGLTDLVEVRQGDAERIDFETGSFGLVIALGVLPFLPSPARALGEFARVTRAGGHVVISSDNRYRINRLLDPRFTPVLSPLVRVVREWRQRRGAGRLGSTIPNTLAGTGKLSLRELDGLIAGAGMTRERAASLGFGPFSFMGRVLLQDAAAIRLHRVLQRSADRGMPVVRSVGLQHLLQARV